MGQPRNHMALRKVQSLMVKQKYNGPDPRSNNVLRDLPIAKNGMKCWNQPW